MQSLAALMPLAGDSSLIRAPLVGRGVVSELQLVSSVLSAWRGFGLRTQRSGEEEDPAAAAHDDDEDEPVVFARDVDTGTITVASARGGHTLAHLSESATRNALVDCAQFLSLASRLRLWTGRVLAQPRTDRCVHAFAAGVDAVLARYDHMLMQYDVEVRHQVRAMSTQLAPGAAPPPPLRLNVPVTLLSLQQHLAPFIRPLTLLGDLVSRLGPAPSAAGLLSALHASLQVQALVESPALAALLLGLFLTALLPYLDLLDAWTAHGRLLERADGCEFMVRGVPVAAGSGSGGDVEYELRLDETGRPLAPAFLAPHAQTILLTGRARAMVAAVRRAHQRDTLTRPHDPRRRRPIGTAADADADEDDPSHSGPNLFTSFHRALWTLLGLPSDTRTLASLDPPPQTKSPIHTRTPDATELANGTVHEEDGVEEKDDDDDDDDDALSYESSSDEDWAYTSDGSASTISAPSSPRRPPQVTVDTDAASEAITLSLTSLPPLPPSAPASIPASAVPSAPATPAALPSGSTKASRDLNAAERDALDIFFATGFDTVHPWLRPPSDALDAPVEETTEANEKNEAQPTNNETTISLRRRTNTIDHNSTAAHAALQHSSSSLSSSTTPDASSGAADMTPPPPPPPSSLARSSLASCLRTSLPASSSAAFLPAVIRRDPLTRAASRDLVRGPEPTMFVVPPSHAGSGGAAAQTNAHLPPWERTKREPDTATVATNAATPASASAFLACVPWASSVGSLQRAIDLMLFHGAIPTHALHAVVPMCLLTSLESRHASATHAFASSLERRAGLVSQLACLRDVFLMADGLLSYTTADALFRRLDAFDLAVVGLDAVVQETMRNTARERHTRERVRQFRLVLVHRRATDADTPSSAATASSDSSPENVSLEHPHSILCLEQLHLEVSVPWPLEVVVSRSSLEGYNRVWRFLLQLRRAELALNECTLAEASAAPRSRRVGAPRDFAIGTRLTTSSVKYHRNANGVQHAFYLLLAEFKHFLRVLLEYALARATDAPWRDLSAKLTKLVQGGDLEQVRRAHDAYVESILFSLLLTPRLVAAAAAVKRVLGLALDLRLLHRTVIADYMEGRPDQFYFVPPPATAQVGPPPPAHTPQWATFTGRTDARRGMDENGVDSDGDDYDDDDDYDPSPRRTGPAIPPHAPHARRICLAGVTTYAQFRTRLYATSMEQLGLIRGEFRQNLRFLTVLLGKIVENGGTHSHRQTSTHARARTHAHRRERGTWGSTATPVCRANLVFSHLLLLFRSPSFPAAPLLSLSSVSGRPAHANPV